MILKRLHLLLMTSAMLLAVLVPSRPLVAAAEWVLIFIPSDSPLMEFVSVCRNGMYFGFAAQDEFATENGDDAPWEITIEQDRNGNLLDGRQLDLQGTDFPVERGGDDYPYRGYFIASWNTQLDVGERLRIDLNDDEVSAVTTVRVQDCLWVNLNVDVAEIGDGGDSTTIEDNLVFEVRANDCDQNQQNGCGINHVVLTVIDPSGQIVHEKVETMAAYCAFGGDSPCPDHDFSGNNFEWENGDEIVDGPYRLRAIIRSDNNGGIDIIDQEIQIQAQ